MAAVLARDRDAIEDLFDVRLPFAAFVADCDCLSSQCALRATALCMSQRKRSRRSGAAPPARSTPRLGSGSRSRAAWLLGAIVLGAGALALFWFRAGNAPGGAAPAAPASSAAPALPPATYVGRATCAGCHAQQVAQWQARATSPQEASGDEVLGNRRRRFRHAGVSRRLPARQRYFVNTDAPDGKLADFEIRYTSARRPCSGRT
jgi:hypothetical protein